MLDAAIATTDRSCVLIIDVEAVLNICQRISVHSDHECHVLQDRKVLR